MNTMHNLAGARRQRGFNLVELMVACAIAVFLLFGLVTIVQNVRQANLNQQALTQLQDEQRFAMSVITDVIQNGGYFPNPVANTPDAALQATGVFLTNGQAFYGTHPGGAASDTVSVRYATEGGDGVILCDGSTNTAAPGPLVPTGGFINQFSVQTAAPGVVGGLYCQVNNGGPSAVAPGILLAPGVTGMTVWYGVKRNCAANDYNVDTYVLANQMSNSGCGVDWLNVSSVRVQLVFTNPLAGQAGQPATITFQRVVEVMARAGVHT